MTMLMFTAANPHASRLASSPDHETAEGRRLEGRGYTVINLLIPLERVQKNEASVTRVQVCLPIPAEARASRKAMLVAVAAMFQARLSKDIDSNSRNHQGGILLRAQSAPIRQQLSNTLSKNVLEKFIHNFRPASAQCLGTLSITPSR